MAPVQPVPESSGVRPSSGIMRALETRIPPPVVMLLLGSVAWVAAWCLPAFGFEVPVHTMIASTVAAIGLALNLLPKLAFRRARTTTSPLAPASTTSLVTSGIYRHTRNPMYLGHAVILLGWTIYLQNMVAFLAVPAFMLYISRYQIQPEEQALSARFPNAFATYIQRTRRWL